MNYDRILIGLNEAVKISKGEMKGRKQSISISPVKEFSHTEIKCLRSNLNITQITFAQIIGVSTKTVEAWEKGTNVPNGPACRLMGMLEEDPQLTEKFHCKSDN